MEPLKVFFKPSAFRQMKKLGKKDRKKVAEHLESLEDEPRPPGVEKLAEHPRLWRTRVGNLRVVYTIADKEGIIVVLVVRDRKDAYRDLVRLSPAQIERTVNFFIDQLSDEAARQ